MTTHHVDQALASMLGETSMPSDEPSTTKVVECSEAIEHVYDPSRPGQRVAGPVRDADGFVSCVIEERSRDGRGAALAARVLELRETPRATRVLPMANRGWTVMQPVEHDAQPSLPGFESR